MKNIIKRSLLLLMLISSANLLLPSGEGGGGAVKVVDSEKQQQKNIFAAIRYNQLDQFQGLFKEYKGDLNFLNNRGNTPLAVACSSVKREIVQFILTCSRFEPIEKNKSDFVG